MGSTVAGGAGKLVSDRVQEGAGRAQDTELMIGGGAEGLGGPLNKGPQPSQH